MAKSKSVVDLAGTIGGLTFVKSIAYGPHVRAARGTYKKAKVNDALKAASRLTIRANAPAQVMRNALLPHLKDFKSGSLWNHLVAIFRKQLKEGGAVSFSKLPAFEINERYPFDRFLPLQPEISSSKKPRALTVRLSYGAHPSFSRSSFIDGYRLGAVAIFPDSSKSGAKTAEAFSRIISLKEKVKALSLELAVPARAKSCVICLRIDGCMGKVVNSTQATKGMKVVWSGVV